MPFTKTFKTVALTAGCLLSAVALAGGPDHYDHHHHYHHAHGPFSGLFVGPDFGVVLSQINSTHTSTTRPIPLPDLNDVSAFTDFGMNIGYGRQWDWFYAGLGFDYSHVVGEYDTTEIVSSNPAVSYSSKMRIKNRYNFNTEFGYVFNPTMMAYISPGLSIIDMRASIQAVVGASEPPVNLNKIAVGPSIGAGMKFLLTPHFVMGFKGVYEYYPEKKTSVTPNTLTMQVKHYSQLNLNFDYLTDF